MDRSAFAMRDAAFIAAVVALSLVWYAPGLGFYSDDWSFLGLYATAADQSVRGLYDASYSAQHAMRPVQLWLCAVLYRLFGMEPAGYHWVNAAFVVLNPILLYAIARALGVPRTIALPLGLTYGLLPNYSTARYWYVAFAITLSMTACLISVYADLKAVTARAPAAAAWKCVAAAAIVGSALAYEVAMPLLLVGVPVLMAWQLYRHRGSVTRPMIIRAVAFVAINVVLIGVIGAFKVKSTVRLGAQQGAAAQVGDIVRRAVRRDLARGEYGLNVVNAVKVHGLEYGVQLVPNAIALARTRALKVTALAIAGALVIAIGLGLALRAEPWPSLMAWGSLVVAGMVVFALGYAIFLSNYNVQFSTTGIANRTAIAASLGSAMGLVGVAGGLVSLLAGRVRIHVFAVAIAIIAGSGLLIVNAVADKWIAAYAAERGVLAGIVRRVPVLPSGSTLLLEGVCPYIGPAIVFESHWDLTGALQVAYRDRGVAANVVTPRMRADADGIVATLYEQPTRYPYSASLFAYHAGTGHVQPLGDAATARAWLARALAADSCPAGHEGLGVELF